MEYKQTIITQVTPFLFKALSESEATQVKGVIESKHAPSVVDYILKKDRLLVLVKSVGAMADFIIKELDELGI